MIPRLTFLISLVTFQSSALLAQYADENLYKSFGLHRDDDNIIQNAIGMEHFFEKLYQIKTRGEGRVNIVHIGDSHIQADFLTHMVRRNFQRDFGHAGRGLIVPARIAGSNEAYTIRTSSANSWEAKRCVFPTQPLPIGIGGITIKTTQPDATLRIKVNDPTVDDSFTIVRLFHASDSNSFSFTLLDSLSNPLSSFTHQRDSMTSTASLQAAQPQVILQAIKEHEHQSHATLFGISLERKEPGVLYHVIGVNGAKYMHYNAASHFFQQIPSLQPDLIIVSLGTNESVEYPVMDVNFEKHIHTFVNKLFDSYPSTAILLVTPPDAFRKKIKTNPGIRAVRDIIIRFAAENGLSFYDMYNALGGDGSATPWRNAGLLRADGIHFSRDGYHYQGHLLYQAIIKRYNQYVSDRHP